MRAEGVTLAGTASAVCSTPVPAALQRGPNKAFSISGIELALNIHVPGKPYVESSMADTSQRLYAGEVLKRYTVGKVATGPEAAVTGPVGSKEDSRGTDNAGGRGNARSWRSLAWGGSRTKCAVGASGEPLRPGSADYRGLTGTRSGAGTRVCPDGISIGPQ